jgi:hypothetical protein
MLFRQPAGTLIGRSRGHTSGTGGTIWLIVYMQIGGRPASRAGNFGNDAADDMGLRVDRNSRRASLGGMGRCVCCIRFAQP